MNALTYAKDFFIVGSILSLILVGSFITLKSGVLPVSRDRGRRVFHNLSQLTLALAGGLAFLLMVQQIVGFRFDSRW